jgi:hypothetical protein
MIMTTPLPGNDLLLAELMKLDSELKLHYPEGKLRQIAALREIKSIFLACNIIPLNGFPVTPPIRHPAINLLSTAVSALEKTLDDIHYAYYANIPPLSQIFPHIDFAPYYSKVNRYQIFFDLTSDQEIIQHGSHASSNSIVWFDPSITHAFINKSATEPWRFVVFDIYK